MLEKTTGYVGLVLCVGGLVGCQTASTASVLHGHASWGRDHWQLSGVMSVHHKKRVSFAHYRWRHEKDRDIIDLWGTFHLASAHLIVTPQHAQLNTSDGKHYETDSAQALMREHLGWYVPISALRYWLRGHADPGVLTIKPVWMNGHLCSLTQWGWQVNWQRYHQKWGVVLPGLITLKQRDWDIRVSINS